MKTIEIKKKDIDNLVNEEINQKKSELQKMMGELKNTKISYPEPDQESIDDETIGAGEQLNVQTPEVEEKIELPSHLEEDAKKLLGILVNAKTVLSKLGNHSDGKASDEMWSYHKKIEKVITDIQRNFKITY